VEAQIGKYEATQFIASLKNPFYYIEQKPNYSVSVFRKAAESIANKEKTFRTRNSKKSD
jgi:hypothetical protein